VDVTPFPERPLRADAERNRQRLLASARELFATKGLSVGLDEIARHAGVGVATAYRRFPDKAQLVDTLYADHVEHLVELAREGLGADDPWAALAAFMERTVEANASNRAVKELMFDSAGDERLALVGRARDQLMPVAAQLLAAAQASGDVRSDVAVTDLPLIQFMVSGLSELGGPNAAALRRRQLALVLDGLRTPGPAPLPAPPLTPREFVEAVTAGPHAGLG